jgi:cysteinyl-tRNA synthetase
MEIVNTLSGKKEPFVPLAGNTVNIYVCGPTTYNYIHLGNARPLVVFDTLRRYLQFGGYAVRYVQNFTDIDDKIIARAREEGVEAAELAAKYIAEYFKDAQALGIAKADAHPKVSEHIPDIIALVQGLVAKGFAYQAEGNVYYRVRAFAEYGKLSGRSLEDMLEGARVEVDARKEHPGDFALWKAAKPGEPAWDSPWGEGRPGWHIECSAMATKYLGETLDIHGGGADLIFPHHENEIAQSEAATNKPLARYWMHNGFITVKQEKMSKSLGNFFLLRDILKQYSGAVIRFYLLSTHYRNPLDFDDGKLLESKKALARLKTTLTLAEEFLKGTEAPAGSAPAAEVGAFRRGVETAREAFLAAMDNDFNTAAAIGTLFDIAHLVNGALAQAEAVAAGEIAYGASCLRQLGDILGIFQEENRPDEQLTAQVQSLCRELAAGSWEQEELRQAIGQLMASPGEDLEALLGSLIRLRQLCRSLRQYAVSDQIRDQLNALGVILEDTKEGARWKLADT